MKKLFALLLTLCMVLSLAACGGSSSSSSAEAPTNDKGVVEGSNKSTSGQADTDVYIDMWGVWANDNYRAIASISRECLSAEGKGLTEINELLGPETAKIFADAGFSKTEVVNDFYDKNRFVFYSK